MLLNVPVQLTFIRLSKYSRRHLLDSPFLDIDARVIHQDVDRTDLICRSAEQSLYVVPLRDIVRVIMVRRITRPVCGSSLELVLTSSGDTDSAAFGHQRQ